MSDDIHTEGEAGIKYIVNTLTNSRLDSALHKFLPDCDDHKNTLYAFVGTESGNGLYHQMVIGTMGIIVPSSNGKALKPRQYAVKEVILDDADFLNDLITVKRHLGLVATLDDFDLDAHIPTKPAGASLIKADSDHYGVSLWGIERPKVDNQLSTRAAIDLARYQQ